MYIQDLTVRGMGGKEKIKMCFSPYTNLICGPNGSGKSSILRILDAAMTGDASPLRGIYFEGAEATLANRENGSLYKLSIDKKDIPEKKTAPVGQKRVSDWRIEPEPLEADGPIWRRLYLPTSRRYTSKRLFAKAPPFKGDPVEKTLSKALHSLWKEYHQRVAEQYGDTVYNGGVGVLEALFSNHERQKRTKLSGSPESAYMRVSSYLDRICLGDPIMSLSSFKKALKNDAGIERIANGVISTEDGIDRLTGELEMLQTLAGAMLGARYNVAIDLDGMRIKTKRDEPVDRLALSAGEKNALIMLLAALGARGGVLIVDDVDASLHYDLHKDLTKNMRLLNPDGQFILTTHSLRMMDYVDKGSCFWLGKNGVKREGEGES